MRKIGALVCLLVSMASLNANALFVRCEMDFAAKSVAFVGEFGGGEGQIVCWDSGGREYVTDLQIVMFAAGIKAGFCQTSGHMEAVGAGFTLNEFLSGLLQVEIGSIFMARRSVALGLKLNPFGTHVNVTFSDMIYKGPCAGIGSVQGLIAKPVGRSFRRF